jgi:hypothetical protein
VWWLQVLVMSNITAAALSMTVGAAIPSVALANMVSASQNSLFLCYN